MARMGLIVFAKTGHVLGAFTRTADPEGAVTPAQVVGTGLAIRDPDTGEDAVQIGPQSLKVETIDRDDEVIASHRHYIFKDGLATEFVELAAANPVVSYASGTLTVTLDAAPADDIVVWVQLESPQTEPKLIPVDVLAAVATGTATVTLTPGTYQVLVLAPEYSARLTTLTV